MALLTFLLPQLPFIAFVENVLRLLVACLIPDSNEGNESDTNLISNIMVLRTRL